MDLTPEEKQRVHSNIQRHAQFSVLNIEKRILNEIEQHCVEPVKVGGLSPSYRKTCGRQVFATPEVADRAMRNLNDIGIPAQVERCKTCGLLHIE